VLSVPDDYELVTDAAAVATSGDTILVSPGNHDITGVVTLVPGVVLLADGPPDSTLLGTTDHGDYFHLVSGAPDTTIIEGFEILFDSQEGTYSGIIAETPAAIIRGNVFTDLTASWGSSSTVHLRDGGVVEHNVFLTGANKGIYVEAGDALIRYNTWNVTCGPFNGAEIAVGTDVDDARQARAEIRNNTFLGSILAVAKNDAGTEVELVNNIFYTTYINCGGLGKATLHIHHNLLFELDFSSFCDGVLEWGEGNIDWRGGPEGLLFCEEDYRCWELYVDKDSEVVGAGENGETMGAWPVGCGFSPVIVDPAGTTSAAAGLRLGLPRPNPMQHRTRMPLGHDGDGPVILEVFDVAGHLVRRVLAGSQEMEIGWDGTASNGQAVPSGTYYLRLVGSDQIRTVRVLR